MAITRREADIRRDQDIDRSVWLYYQPKTAPHRCCICGEGFYDGRSFGDEEVCEECHEEQMRLVARYLNPLYADRFEELIKDEAIKL